MMYDTKKAVRVLIPASVISLKDAATNAGPKSAIISPRGRDETRNEHIPNHYLSLLPRCGEWISRTDRSGPDPPYVS